MKPPSVPQVSHPVIWYGGMLNTTFNDSHMRLLSYSVVVSVDCGTQVPLFFTKVKHFFLQNFT